MILIRYGTFITLTFFLFRMTFPSQLCAQQYSYHNYTRQQGLASNTVYKVVQDSVGFIWAATDNGLSRFDGTHFQNFSTDESLPDNEIVNLYVDSQNRLWYTTISGLFGYYQEGHFHNAGGKKLKGLSSMRSNFQQVKEDHLGQLWFGTMNSGLYLLRGDSIWQVINSMRTMVAGEVQDGKMLVVSGNPLPIVDGKSVSLTASHMLVDVEDLSIEVMAHWPGGSRPGFEPMIINDTLVVGFGSFGLLAWNYLSNETWWLGLGPKYPKVVPSNFIRLRNGMALASLRGHGAELFTVSSTPIPHITVEGYYLEKSDITSSLEDRSGRLWFSTMDQGLFYLPHQDVRLHNLPNPGNTGLTRRICLDPSSQESFLLKGTSVYQISDTLREILRLADNSPLDARDIVCFPGEGKFFVFDMWVIWQPEKKASDQDPLLMMSLFTEKRVANKIPYLSNPITVPGHEEVGIATPPLKQCVRGKGSDVWIAGSLTLIRMEVDPSKPLSEVLQIRQVIPTPRLYGLCWGKGGTLYVAGEPGLLQLESDTLKVVMNTGHGLKSRISKMVMLPDSSIIFGTHGQGVYHVMDGKTIILNRNSGLPSNICNDLFLDQDSLLWVATQKGLALLKWGPGGLTLVQHPVTQLAGNNKILHVARHGERVLISSEDVLISHPFSGSRLQRNDYPMLITDLRVNGKSRPVEPSIRLQPNENNLHFQFVGLDFLSNGKLTYQYRMLNSDSTWATTDQNSIEYSQLPHGTYTFEVRALAFDGHQSANVASLSFTVLPYWYQTWAFKLLAGFSVAAAGGGLFWLRTSAIRRRNQMELRLLESEQKALRSQMNPHFIFNSLNSIQRFLATNNPNESIRYLTKFGRLMRSILDHSRESAIPIADELDTLRLYLELESLRTGNKFDSVITLDSALDELGDRIPPLLLQPYVENAIWHGVMAKEGRGEIRITISKKESSIHCSIEDNGIGRAKAREIKGANPTGRKSHGMNITAERLALLNRDRPRAITVQITDLHDSEGNAAGTRVEMDIPREF